MEEAKAAIKNFTSHHGHHETTVHEHHKPSVTHEHVTPTRHDEGTTVVDREVHQDHYHTNVQPIHQREVLPEEHKHKILPTEQKEYHHGDPTAVKEHLAGEQAKFRDASETGATQFTKSIAPEVQGEHVHHHIHETIQPVVQKETIQPTVVHTTKPVHEVHHNAAQHHTATVLPAVDIADFKHQGGSLTGAKDRVTHYEGEPDAKGRIGGLHQSGTHHGGTARVMDDAAGAGPTGRVTNEESVLRNERPREGHAGATADTIGGVTGEHRHEPHGAAALGGEHRHEPHGAAALGGEHRHEPQGTAARMDPRVDSQRTHVGGADSRTPIANEFANRDAGATLGKEHSTTSQVGPLGEQHRVPHAADKQQPPTGQFADTHIGAGKDGNTTYNSNFEAANIRHEPAAQEKSKPSLLDKLNPMKDTDGDGKKGFMK